MRADLDRLVKAAEASLQRIGRGTVEGQPVGYMVPLIELDAALAAPSFAPFRKEGV